MKNTGLNSIPSVQGQMFPLTINLVCIGIFYVFFGAFISYWISKIFPKFDSDWEKYPNWIQLLDVSAEISLIVIIAFWLTYIVNRYIPVLHVKSGLERYIESFCGQMIFVYAVFLFMGTLDDKLKHVFRDFFE